MAYTNAELEKIREMVGEDGETTSDIALRGASHTAEQQAETRTDIDDWAPVRRDKTKLQGGRFGLFDDPNDVKIEIRKAVRQRFGYPALGGSDLPSNAIYLVQLRGAQHF